MGPGRDGVWPEQGIVTEFPEEGLKARWRASVGLGYSGPAVVDGRVYLMDYEKQAGELVNRPGSRTSLMGRERILCFDSRTGELLWEHGYLRPYRISYAGGPRCTPTVAAGKVFALGAEGNLTCLDAREGTVVWARDLKQEYGVETPQWGHAAHPLFADDTLYCLVGGEGSLVVAFEAATGKERWRSLSGDHPGYCPPNLVEAGGVRQLIVWHPDALASLDLSSGRMYWSLPLKPAHNLPSAMPRQSGNYLYASAIGNIAALIRLDDAKPEASMVWRGRGKEAVYCSNSTPFLTDDTIYGCDIESSALIAVNMADGTRLWQTTVPTLGREDAEGRHGTAFLVRNGDRFFIFSETGDLILARLTRERYEEISRQNILEPTNEAFRRRVVWSHPAYAEKCVFARNDKELICISLASEE